MTRFSARTSFLALAALAGLGCSAVLPPGFGQPSPAPSAAANAPSFKAAVVPVLQEHCARCHAAGGQGAGGVTMFDGSGTPDHAEIKARMNTMIDVIKGGSMPLDKKTTVTAAQLQTLEAWVAGGAPNN